MHSNMKVTYSVQEFLDKGGRSMLAVPKLRLRGLLLENWISFDQMYVKLHYGNFWLILVYVHNLRVSCDTCHYMGVLMGFSFIMFTTRNESTKYT